MDKKIALVTGASRGIGRAVAAALAASGCHVLINYRSRQPEAAETLARIQHAGGSGELYPFDVADVAACGPAVVKQMALQRRGRIVTIASTAGQTGVEGQTNYAAAKAGVIGASKALAREVAKRGVTVNVLAPGFIETDMTAGLPRAPLLAQIPAGRFGQPEEVAAAAVFLCSEAAGYITGAVLNINGGVYT